MKRSILGLVYLIQGMRKAGLEVDPKLHAVGLRAEALESSAVIHPTLEWNLLQVVGKNVNPALGLWIGQHYNLVGYGPLLMLLVTSSRVEVALQKAVEYQRLTHLTGELSLRIESERVGLCYVPEQLNTDLGLLRAHCEISSTFKFLSDLYKTMGLKVPKLAIELPFFAPETDELMENYARVYGDHLLFDRGEAIFWCDRTVLDKAIPSADAMTFKAYEHKCVSQMNRLQLDEKEPLLLQRVYDYLELQQGMLPTMAQTAQVLQIPERTLRHQLQQLGSSYKDIREQIMKDKALELIEYKEYSIEMIAELLGYSEPAAFNHAFKRWFGQSPRQYHK